MQPRGMMRNKIVQTGKKIIYKMNIPGLCPVSFFHSKWVSLSIFPTLGLAGNGKNSFFPKDSVFTILLPRRPQGGGSATTLPPHLLTNSTFEIFEGIEATFFSLAGGGYGIACKFTIPFILNGTSSQFQLSIGNTLKLLSMVHISCLFSGASGVALSIRFLPNPGRERDPTMGRTSLI